MIWPFLVAYYTYKSAALGGPLAPIIIYGFFLVGTAINTIVAAFLVGFIFKQERLEGNFRFLHVSFRTSAEPIAFLDGVETERIRLEESLALVIGNQSVVVNRTALVKCIYLPTSSLFLIDRILMLFFFLVFTNLFSYLGSILSYAIVAIPLFSGQYDDLSDAELSQKISEVSTPSCFLILNCDKPLLTHPLPPLLCYSFSPDLLHQHVPDLQFHSSHRAG